MKNVFTIDTEDWFHANYEEGFVERNRDVRSTVEENTETYLQILDRYKAKATFFVVGQVAEKHPELIKKISALGHEIGSHSFAHRLVYQQTQKEFREDTYRSKCMLEDLTGKQVIGFRAPSWSITEKSFWALEILNDLGFKYDSSIIPFKNFLYGVDGAPRYPYLANRYCQGAGELLEIPTATAKILKLTLPFAGGFYLRALPYSVISHFAQSTNKKGYPVVFYLHPREIDRNHPKIKLGLRDALIHYYGVRGCRKKFEKIVQQFECTSMKDAFFK